MTQFHGGTKHVKGVVNRGTERKPSPYHAGSGKLKGRVNAAPTLPQVNDQNYAGHKVKRK